MNKLLLKNRFEKCLETYNNQAFVQREMALNLASNINNSYYENILEIGCGTGLLTKILCEKVTFRHYIANDIIDKCDDYIKLINKNIDFISCDTEDIFSLLGFKFDLIVSNAVFQWVDDIEMLVEKLVQSLNCKGMLLFTTFGQDNFKEINSITQRSLKYYSAKELKIMFSRYNCTINENRRVVEFNSPKEVLLHIKQTGVNSMESVQWTKGMLKNFEDEYNRICDNKPTLTYHPIYVKIKV